MLEKGLNQCDAGLNTLIMRKRHQNSSWGHGGICDMKQPNQNAHIAVHPTHTVTHNARHLAKNVIENNPEVNLSLRPLSLFDSPPLGAIANHYSTKHRVNSHSSSKVPVHSTHAVMYSTVLRLWSRSVVMMDVFPSFEFCCLLALERFAPQASRSKVLRPNKGKTRRERRWSSRFLLLFLYLHHRKWNLRGDNTVQIAPRQFKFESYSQQDSKSSLKTHSSLMQGPPWSPPETHLLFWYQIAFTSLLFSSEKIIVITVIARRLAMPQTTTTDRYPVWPHIIQRCV